MIMDKPEKFENEILNQINDILSGISEMSYLERCFLNGIIRQDKPKKILELGVSAGGNFIRKYNGQYFGLSIFINFALGIFANI